jgi:predicted MFS family arabinose efflux permease
MLLGGAVADRVDRRHILVTSNVLQMTFAGVLAVLFHFDRLGIAAILLAALGTGLAQSQSAPTYQAVITSLVPPKQIQSAVALNSLQFNLSRTLGPALAGILLARAGVGACLTANTLSFLAVIVALWRIELPPPAPSKGSIGSSVRAGLRHVWSTPDLRLYTVLALVGSFLAFPLITYLPLLADDILKTGARGYAQLLSAFGAGAIVGAIVTAQRGAFRGRGKVMLAAMAVYATSALGALFAGGQRACMALLFLCGITLVSSFSTLNALVQESAAPELKGRILSVWGLAFRGGGPMGNLLSGALMSPFGLRPVLSSAFVLLIAAAGYSYVTSKDLRAL